MLASERKPPKFGMYGDPAPWWSTAIMVAIPALLIGIGLVLDMTTSPGKPMGEPRPQPRCECQCGRTP